MVVGGAQQNRVTPSPFDFGLWTLDLDLDCDNKGIFLKEMMIFVNVTDVSLERDLVTVMMSAGEE